MTDADKVPRPTTSGAEVEALARFCPDVTWAEAIHEGGMGPGTPAMTADGWASTGASRKAAGSSAPTSGTSSCWTVPSC
jgi:hypothetical protein